MIRINSDSPGWCIFLAIVLWVYSIICWVVNVYKFFVCDFADPWKEEIIRGIGILFPPITWVTAWIQF